MYLSLYVNSIYAQVSNTRFIIQVWCSDPIVQVGCSDAIVVLINDIICLRFTLKKVIKERLFLFRTMFTRLKRKIG